MTIQKNIPIPKKKTNDKYSFRKMEVNDCITVPKPTPIISAAHMYAKRKGWKFVSRDLGDSIRIWRTE